MLFPAEGLTGKPFGSILYCSTGTSRTFKHRVSEERAPPARAVNRNGPEKPAPPTTDNAPEWGGLCLRGSSSVQSTSFSFLDTWRGAIQMGTPWQAVRTASHGRTTFVRRVSAQRRTLSRLQLRGKEMIVRSVRAGMRYLSYVARTVWKKIRSLQLQVNTWPTSRGKRDKGQKQ